MLYLGEGFEVVSGTLFFQTGRSHPDLRVFRGSHHAESNFSICATDKSLKDAFTRYVLNITGQEGYRMMEYRINFDRLQRMASCIAAASVIVNARSKGKCAGIEPTLMLI